MINQERYIYVAGPLYGGGHLDENIKAAITISDMLSSDLIGAVPFLPHLYTFWHFRSDKHVDEWLRFDKAWLRKCDALVRIQGESPGASLEQGWAEEWDMPVLQLPSVKEIQASCGGGRGLGYWDPYLMSELLAWVEALPK